MADSNVPPYVQAFSGSVGASLAKVLIYPLDLVAARIQTKTPKYGKKGDTYADLPTALSTIYKAGGIPGFYQGITSDTLSTALANFLYFYVYSALQRVALKRKSKLNAIEQLMIGSLAGIASRFVTTPLGTITVRKQTAATIKEKDQEKGVEAVEDEEDQDSDYSSQTSLSIAKDIYESHGITGFWRGYVSACILTVNPSITFYLIETFKRIFVPARYRANPSQAQTFLISATSSAIASAICYPLILSKTRLQWKSPDGRLLYSNMTDVFHKTVKKSGVAGLYVGLQTQLIKGFLAHGVTMVLKQRTELLIIYLYRMLWLRRKSLA